MTRLLLDVGNSRLKWQVADGVSSTVVGSVEHAGDPAAALAALSLPESLRGASGLAANVTGAAHEEALVRAALERHGVALLFARVRDECLGLRIAYAEASRLGVDRWLQMLALWSEQRAAFVVASAGTALTCDAVDAKGQHLGGIIAPGLLTSQQAVLGATRFAARGPDLDYSAGLGRDTEACVRQGALHACAGLLDRLGRQYADASARRVLCGGDSAVLLPHLADAWQLRSELVMSGLLSLPAG